MLRTICDFYENMDEIVYAADLDSNTIYFMNRKARELYGFHSAEEVRGRKCYEVLQGSSSPCEICTNGSLKPGDFVEWKYHNPVFGKEFALKDTLVEEDGHRYRIEIAIDISTQEIQRETIQEYMDNEAMLNEGLRVSLAVSDPEESIRLLLEYLGKALKSERVYIFEKSQPTLYDNTYEWCADGVSTEMQNLQNVPIEALKFWVERFKKNQNVVIRNLEEEKEKDPLAYEYLAPQMIRSLVASPLVYDNELIGFYGVDNPPGILLGNISTLLQIMGHFIVSLLRRRNLMRHLEMLSYYDQLTGCGNRHAMDDFFASVQTEKSIGVVYCDVMGLKRINDTLGHRAGDNLLVRASDCLKDVFSDFSLFRIGGDEFLVMCAGISQEELERRVRMLKIDMTKHSAMMAIGCTWYPNCSQDMDKLLAEADERMYEQKREYYAVHENKQ